MDPQIELDSGWNVSAIQLAPVCDQRRSLPNQLVNRTQ
jgi:hypothetical protein